jgi:hypothetical protein
MSLMALTPLRTSPQFVYGMIKSFAGVRRVRTDRRLAYGMITSFAGLQRVEKPKHSHVPVQNHWYHCVTCDLPFHERSAQPRCYACAAKNERIREDAAQF